MNSTDLLLVAAVGFLLAAMALLLRSAQLRRSSGLPRGKVVYEDASGLIRRPLVSARYGLSGKPDYLLRNDEGDLIPVEVKSGRAPRGGRAHKSHLLQLAVYFLLVEDALLTAPPYGLIRYRDRTVTVENTDALIDELLAAVERMRALLAGDEARRSHNQPRRCAKCSLAHACDERLG